MEYFFDRPRPEKKTKKWQYDLLHDLGKGVVGALLIWALACLIFLTGCDQSLAQNSSISFNAMTHTQGKVAQVELDYYPIRYLFAYGDIGAFMKNNTLASRPSPIFEGGVGASVTGGPVFLSIKQGISWQQRPFQAVLFGEYCDKSKIQLPTSFSIGITEEKFTIAAVLEHYSSGVHSPTNTPINFYGVRFIYSL